MISSTSSSAAPLFLGLQTSWSRHPLGQTRPVGSGYSIPDGKRFMSEEAWLETTVPKQNGESQIVDPIMVSSTSSSAAPLFPGLQTSWSGYSIPGKRFVEETWLETTVPMSFPKRRRVNSSDVVEEPIVLFSQPSFENDQGGMALMNDTQVLLATSDSYSSIDGDSSNCPLASKHNTPPHSFLSIDNFVPMPEDFSFHPNGEFMPSYSNSSMEMVTSDMNCVNYGAQMSISNLNPDRTWIPTMVKGDCNIQREFC